jgi:hypothetical protein
MQCNGALPIFIITLSPTSYYGNLIALLPTMQSYDKFCLSQNKNDMIIILIEKCRYV